MAEACISSGELNANSQDDQSTNLITGMAEDKHQQTAMWQQAQYFGDSGIHSGVTTKAPSVCGGSYHDDTDDKSHVCLWEHGCCSSSSGSLTAGFEQAACSAVDKSNNLRVDVGTEEHSTVGRADFKTGCQLSPINSRSGSSQLLESALVNLMDYQDGSDLTSCAIPELVKLLQSGSQRVMSRAAAIVHQLTKKETSRQAVMSSLPLVSSLVQAVDVVNDMETFRSLAGAMHNLSHHRQGLLALYKSSGIAALVQLLSVPLEAVLFYSITALHNLLLHQDGSKIAVRAAGGLHKMVSLLKSRNAKFLAVTADCLQILAYGNQESKLAILACGGPAELVRVMTTYSYEKLLWTASRVLKVLSVCPYNKPAIVEAGGVTALSVHLHHTSARLVQNCLWTLRNLSDAATRVGGLDLVLPTLVQLLSSADPHQAMCAAGILSNLTCNNQQNKTIVCRSGGVEALTRIIVQSRAHSDIVEPAVCALRHLTNRHPDAEVAQRAVRLHYGLGAIVRLLQPSTRWTLLKATLGLLQNLSLCTGNQLSIREHGAVSPVVQLFLQAMHIRLHQQPLASTVLDHYSRRGTTLIDEVVECTLSTLHILARDPHVRPVIRGFNCLPIIVELLHSHIESLQQVAAGVLCEIVSDPEGAEDVERTHAVAPLLKLMESSNEGLATFAAATLFRLSELVTRRGLRQGIANQGYTPLPNVCDGQQGSANSVQGVKIAGQVNLMVVERSDTCLQAYDDRSPTDVANSASDVVHSSGETAASSHPASEDRIIDYAGLWSETDL